jgi:hypothetical protein
MKVLLIITLHAPLPKIRAIVLSSFFLHVFIQLQLWYGVIFGIIDLRISN